MDFLQYSQYKENFQGVTGGEHLRPSLFRKFQEDALAATTA